MAIVLGNLVVTGKVETANSVSSANEKQNVANPADGSHVLIVNGKEKKIGKKSAYLLDMLTLDDE